MLEGIPVAWVAIVGAAVGTYLLRLSFIALYGRVDEVPPRLDVVLTYVPPAVLAALVLPAVLAPSGSLAVSLGNDRLLAGLVAAAVAWYTDEMLATIVAGMGVLWTLSFLL